MYAPTPPVGVGGYGISTPGSGTRSAPFSRTASTTDASFASTTVTLPRSTKPIGVALSTTAACLVRVQGNGQEFFARAVSPNIPAYIVLDTYPPSLTVVIQSKFPAKGSLVGSIDYQ